MPVVNLRSVLGTMQYFPGGSDGKESACNARDLGSVPGLGRSPGEGNGYPLQYSCLEIPMDRGAWRATVHGVAKNQKQILKIIHVYTCLSKHDSQLPKSVNSPIFYQWMHGHYVL